MYRFAFAALLILTLAEGRVHAGIQQEANQNAQITTGHTATIETGSNHSLSASQSDGGAMEMEEETDRYSFSYSWPSEAGGEPELVASLKEQMAMSRKEIIDQANEAYDDAAENDYPYYEHYLSVEWKTVTSLPQYLSLSANIATYGGGAHGNSGFASLIWDKKNNEAMDAVEMFSSSQALEKALAPRFCSMLNAQRTQRRGSPVDPSSTDQFDTCPPLSDLTILLGSKGGKRFDRIGLLAAQYVAGPYAEGPYEITLPVDDAVLDTIKFAYRQFFAAS